MNNTITLFNKNYTRYEIYFMVFDFFLFTFFFVLLAQDIYFILLNSIELFYSIFNTDLIISSMDAGNSVNASGSNTGSNINTTIEHSSDGWASGIKSIFIYGTGALRLSLLRSGGSPVQRSFIIGSTILTDAGASFLRNAINDPNYVENHINSWKRVWLGQDGAVAYDVSNDTEISNVINSNTNNLNSTAQFSTDLFNWVIGQLKPILQPVTVDYPTEVLANQLYGISIILFIMSIGVLVLLISFMINIILFVYSERILNYFTNKYIRWYITFNRKMIAVEIWFLGGSLVYFMYYISYGIHFLATHPIVFK